MELSGTGNHLDHFIRQTRVHHMHLSSMADTKANIMLTISALIITFSIGHLSDPHLRWPVLVLIVSCFATVVSAAYAVMPKLDTEFRPDLDRPDCNILFFGNFMNLEYEEYARLMEGVMSNPSRVYEAQVREVYELGVFLGRRKYVYIRLAYKFFIGGLLASAAVFAGVEILTAAR
jgi:hypothetical protein